VTATATQAWTTSAPYARSIADPDRPLILHTDTGEQLVLNAGRFTADPDAVDHAVLDRCTGPTLDLGCGPGRLVAELARRGIPALGVDVAPAAVLLGRAAGAAVLRRSVFDRLPGTGRWPHALLMDGNIGIGGDPAALLRRIRDLLLPSVGELVVETEPNDVFHTYRVGFDRDAGERFGWTRVGTEALVSIADASGFVIRERWTHGARRFVALGYPPPKPATATVHE
jgi:SAM-dependent methyltransferase